MDCLVAVFFFAADGAALIGAADFFVEGVPRLWAEPFAGAGGAAFSSDAAAVPRR